MSSIDLSPAEALLLLDPEFADFRRVLKLSLRWLIAHGVLLATREKKPGTFLFRVRPRLQIVRTSEEIALPRDLADLIELTRSAPTDFFDDIFPVILWTYGIWPSRAMGEKIKQSLVARQLMTSRPAPNMVWPGRQAYERTPEGNILCERLASLLAQARAIPQIIASGPERVAALAAPLDGLLLLLTELRPEWPEIAKALSGRGTRTVTAYPGFDLSRLDRQILDAMDAYIDSD